MKKLNMIKYIAIVCLFLSSGLSAQTIKESMKPAVKKGGFKMEGFILWCPSVIKVGKTYHMFASRWPEKYGLGGWTKYSEVVRATSDNLFGPYKFQEVIIQKREGFWDNDRAHNPKIVKAGNMFVLYYISSANETGYAYSKSITGPWTRIDALAMPFSNPAPLVKKDGSIYVFGRKSINDIRIAQGYTAPAFNAKYTLLNSGKNLLPGNNQLEDPTIWWASNQYNVILSDFRGDLTGTGKNGAQYYSIDGINYKPVSRESVYTKTVNYDDGSSYTFRRRERPFVYVNEKGAVTAFFTSCLTQDANGHEQSWIEVQPVDNYVPKEFQKNPSGLSYSQLWGENGEKWDSTRIPDFTNAGYKGGKVKIPVFPVGVNVVDYGAVGDGITDNTAAFKKAIAKCGSNQAVYVPAGTYLIKDTLQIKKGGISIRGDKKKPSIIYFEKGIEELYPNYNIQNKNQTAWSWSGAMILFSGNSSDVGIEDITVMFPDNPWTKHDFHEKGYNGVGFGDGVHDGWLRNVTITGSDLGIWIARKAHHITAENWTLDFGPLRKTGKINGHHGVNIYGGYNLLQNFTLKGKFQHDLSVESANSIYNVFSSGEGEDICIDHHNHAQSHNLFTDINAGLGSRIYASGGNDTPRGICTYETFWNITSQNPMVYCNQFDTNDAHSKNNITVAINTNLPSVFKDVYSNWFESIAPSKIYPANLYKAQMLLKIE